MTKQKTSSNYYMYGKHASIAALQNKNRKIYKIFITKENQKLIPDEFKKITKIIENKDFIEFLPKEVPHQGIALYLAPLENYEIDLYNTQKEAKIVILDQITDPQNFGSIIRSAAAFDIDLIMIPNDNSANENATIAKAACGALELVKISRIVNISSTIKILKKCGFWVIGLDGETKEVLSSKMLQGKICLILGAEGKGMRRLTKENCDIIAKIPISKNVESLNVASAASIAFYHTYLEKLYNNANN